MDQHRHRDGVADGVVEPPAGIRIERRRALVLLGGLGLGVGLSACGITTGTTPLPPTSTTTPSGASPSTTEPGGQPGTTGTVPGPSCSPIPEETAGPYPADGTNGPDVLSLPGVVRPDVTASFDGPTGVAGGVPLTIELTVLDASSGCTPLQGAAVYVWHCDDQGRYSMYSPGVTGENWLRGVQETGADGVARFASVFPGCEPGRWPHVHLEVFPGLVDATAARNVLATTQMALPPDACTLVYGQPGYEPSAAALKGVSLQSDPVFRDGWNAEMGTVSGTLAEGLTVRLDVPIRASGGHSVL